MENGILNKTHTKSKSNINIVFLINYRSQSATAGKYFFFPHQRHFSLSVFFHFFSLSLIFGICNKITIRIRLSQQKYVLCMHARIF